MITLRLKDELQIWHDRVAVDLFGIGAWMTMGGHTQPFTPHPIARADI
jgi:hypothetical protein